MAKKEQTAEECKIAEIAKGLGMPVTELMIMITLARAKKPMPVLDICAKIDRDRTTVQKTLTKLEKRGITDKRQMNLDRGFMFCWFLKIKLKEKLVEIFEDSHKCTLSLINSL